MPLLLLIDLYIYMSLCVMFKVPTFQVHNHSFSTKKEIKKANILSKNFHSPIIIIFIVNIQTISNENSKIFIAKIK